jgi:hypothetical protein
MLNGAEADVIDYPASNGTFDFWGPFSGGNQSFGQIFTAPQPVLDDYSLTVQSTNSFPFVSQVFQWNSGTVGSALYTSATLLTTTSGYVTYTFTPERQLDRR